MFSISPFSTEPFSDFVFSVNATSLIEAIATVEANAKLDIGAVSSIEGIAILTADGTLTLGGRTDLSVVASVLANATVRGEDANIFIWTAPERKTTWTIPN
tara:strand:- start:11942 stop:12244 length:303 start_codon:yes stop_codon:yes gene_type:complete